MSDEPSYWAGRGGVSPKVFPGETSSPPRATSLLSNAISTSERLVSLIKHLAPLSHMNGYHFWPGARVLASNLPINDPNFENWGDGELKTRCRLQEAWCHWKTGHGYLSLTPKVTLRVLQGRSQKYMKAVMACSWFWMLLWNYYWNCFYWNNICWTKHRKKRKITLPSLSFQEYFDSHNQPRSPTALTFPWEFRLISGQSV